MRMASLSGTLDGRLSGDSLGLGGIELRGLKQLELVVGVGEREGCLLGCGEGRGLARFARRGDGHLQRERVFPCAFKMVRFGYLW